MEIKNIEKHIIKLHEERKSLIYGFDKVFTENRKRYEEIQKELLEIEEQYGKIIMDKLNVIQDNMLNNKKSHFILDENNNVIEADLISWAKFLDGNRERRIVKKEDINDFHVSTVFVGLDHNIAGLVNKEKHRPHIFETMIFKNDKDIYCARYSTWEEAEFGHKIALEWINNEFNYDELEWINNEFNHDEDDGA